MLDAEMFVEIFKESSTPTDAGNEKSKEIISNVVVASMRRCRNDAHRLPKLWWKDEIK